ncbi:MAG TPA: peptide-methionine (S)-S-oxide reductase MsrA [Clostridiaceae bacterium]
MKKIVLAGGCFWGVEGYINTLNGIISTEVGYVNGLVPNPTYEMVCQSNTGYAEGCYIEYDEAILDLSSLLDSFWKVVDPTVINRQGHDIGSQYRTGIYYTDPMDLPIALASKAQEQKKYDKEIVTEIKVLDNFYKAEGYHQKYLEKNPNGYCHIPKKFLEKK